MLLQLHEWGERGAPPIVALHGIGGFGRRFRRLAEEKLVDFNVLAPDLRGHGVSSWDPPWTMSSHVADVLETLDHEGIRHAAFIGHSYGGRLILELAAVDPARIERAVLLDPAIQILPHVAFDFAERERVDMSFGSPQEAIDERLGHEAHTPIAFVEEDVREHLESDGHGGFRYRYCRSAVVTGYGELCSSPPPPETLHVPTLLVYAPEFKLVRDEQLEAYSSALGDLLRVVELPGGHFVIWDSYEETAAALLDFLR
jgi:lipase